jgi:phage terminase small subunit
MATLHKLAPPIKRNLPPPPSHLEPIEAAMWQRLLSEYELDTAGELALLEEALASHMRARRCREQIAREGETVLDRFEQLQAHPLLAAERGARQAFASVMRLLRLDVPAPPKPGAF